MQSKIFRAKTTKEALSHVSREMGPDAVNGPFGEGDFRLKACAGKRGDPWGPPRGCVYSSLV